jgi:hypothetical protein
MGNFYSDTVAANIDQTQIAQINQDCKQATSSQLSDIQITAIDSHVGDITLSSTLNVGNLDCVLSAVAQASAQSAVSNSSIASITALPFQLNANSISVSDYINIQSYQQSLINQTCTQSAASSVSQVDFTIIDSTTGNIKVASSAQIEGFSCNLTSNIYQSAAAQVTNSSTGKISSGCCLFDLGMVIPIVLGLVGLLVVSKLAKSKGAQGGGGGAGSNPLSEEAEEFVDLTGGANNAGGGGGGGNEKSSAPIKLNGTSTLGNNRGLANPGRDTIP